MKSSLALLILIIFNHLSSNAQSIIQAKNICGIVISPDETEPNTVIIDEYQKYQVSDNECKLTNLNNKNEIYFDLDCSGSYLSEYKIFLENISHTIYSNERFFMNLYHEMNNDIITEFPDVKYLYGKNPNLHAISMVSNNSTRYICFNPDTLYEINRKILNEYISHMSSLVRFTNEEKKRLEKIYDIRYFILAHELAHHFFYDIDQLSKSEKITYELNADYYAILTTYMYLFDEYKISYSLFEYNYLRYFVSNYLESAEKLSQYSSI